MGLFGASARPNSDYEFIAKILGDNLTDTFTFNSIPSNYTHLQVRYFVRNTANVATFYMKIPEVTSNVFARHSLIGSGTATSATNITGQAVIAFLNGSSGTGSAGNAFRGGIIDLLDYSSASKNKVIRAIFGGIDDDQPRTATIMSGLVQNTGPVTSLNFFVDSGFFNQATVFSLYGIRG